MGSCWEKQVQTEAQEKEACVCPSNPSDPQLRVNPHPWLGMTQSLWLTEHGDQAGF